MVVTKSPGVMKDTTTFYINGQLDAGTGIRGETPNLLPGPFALGTSFDGSSYKYDGKIGYSAVYDDVLTAAEVEQNFNALRPRFASTSLPDTLVDDSVIVQFDPSTA